MLPSQISSVSLQGTLDGTTGIIMHAGIGLWRSAAPCAMMRAVTRRCCGISFARTCLKRQQPGQLS